MENPPLPDFPGRRAGTTRQRALSQREVVSCCTANRLTDGSRTGAAPSLFKSARRHPPSSRLKVNLLRSRRTRARYSGIQIIAITCGIVILDVQLAGGRAGDR